NVTFQLPRENAREAMKVAAEARKLLKEIEAGFPDIRIYITGMVMMNNAFGEASANDNLTLVPAMYGIVVLALLLSLRSIGGVVTVVLLILMSILSALGIAGWLGWSLTPTSAIAPTIILTMAVADCVHLLVTMLHNMRIGHEKRQAIRESLRINMQPVFITSLTTAIGFLSMNFSDAPPFRDLGNIVALGVTLAFFLSIIFLPAMMAVLPVRVKLRDDLDNAPMQRLADFVIRRRKALLVANGVLAVGLIAFAPLNRLNDEYVKYFDKSTEFRQGTDFLNENMSGIYTIEFSVHAAEEGGISEPAFLKKIDAFYAWLKTQPEVIHVNAVTDTFKRLNRNMHGDDPGWHKLPDRRDLAAQYLLLYEMSLPYGLDLNDQINIDKSAVRVIATMQSMSSNQMLDVEDRVNRWLEQNMHGAEVEAASPVLMFSHIGKRNIVRMIAGTLAALALISLILIAAFKSFRLGLLSLIPNLVPAGIAFGIWGLINGQVGLGLSVVTGMTLGIVVDDTVHFISKYLRARREKGMDSREAVRYAFSTVGVALWITSAVLVSGFIVLSFSIFTMNSEMGTMTAITIAVALLMDFLLLPPLLMTMGEK
ncbi:MAG: efflux RND transporter permease subunit, partial [Gammaproteobacteria bacterium]